MEDKFFSSPADLRKKTKSARRCDPNDMKAIWKPEVFERLWKVWPNQEARDNAIREWDEQAATDDDITAMQRVFPHWKSSDRWNKENGKYVMTLARWLNEHRWKEPPPPPPPSTRPREVVL